MTQLQAAIFIVHCEITVHVSGALCTHHQEHIKTVDAITGMNQVSVLSLRYTETDSGINLWSYSGYREPIIVLQLDTIQGCYQGRI